MASELDAATALLAEQLLRSLAARPNRTAWELKMELKTSHTCLHLALGRLLERGAIRIEAEKLTHRIELNAGPIPAGAAADGAAAAGVGAAAEKVPGGPAGAPA